VGAGIVGIVKTLMLCAVTGVCGFLALNVDSGAAADIGAGLSPVPGVVTRQPYIQSVISGKSVSQAKAGAFVSAALIPLNSIFDHILES
jgi:SSS family solute:Na+ symporter